jgi:hypothetical protein
MNAPADAPEYIMPKKSFHTAFETFKYLYVLFSSLGHPMQYFQGFRTIFLNNFWAKTETSFINSLTLLFSLDGKK